MNEGAFHGSAAVKAELLAIIDRHAAAGTLVFDGTIWDGTRGSPMGIAIQGDDPAAYALRYAIPLPLVTLLDAATAGVPGNGEAIRAAREWVAAIEPGGDLSQAPTRIVLTMLDLPDVPGSDGALAVRLRTLHMRDLTGDPAGRGEWSALRQAIMDHPRTDDDTLVAALIALWEACAWPAAKGRSTLPLGFVKWCAVHARAADPEWTMQDAARTRETLQRLWQEQADARAAGVDVDYHRLFLAADRELAERHLRYLERSNAAFLRSGSEMVSRSIALFREAGRVPAPAG